MLGVRSYPREYIDACRSRVEADISAYRNLVKAASSPPANGKMQSAIQSFEPTFFNNMVLLLDEFFVHRLRTIEGKDGNPLNEVRVMCNSLLYNDNILTADRSIKLSPDKSVLKYQFGDEIKLTEADFLLLSKAFFAEIVSKFA
jgi:hypothetical protein